jgi:tRNA modification GTPase
MTDTIFALSSGSPPAAIGVVRVSGAAAGAALEALCRSRPAPRRASYRTLRDSAGEVLDRALVLWFPGPATATGEDLAELHLHGGRSVIAAVQHVLAAMPGLRPAEPGEFTRRAFANGRIDLSEAEGLADLLSAETELQRRSALAMAGGDFGRTVKEWRDRVLLASALVESVLDFGDEDDVEALPDDFLADLSALAASLQLWLDRPRAEMLKEGFRVVLAGPPNSGKSTLFNALVEDEAAITAPQAGTTRDVLTRSVALGGVPFTFVDTAGLRTFTEDEIELVGIERAQRELAGADLVLWLGAEGEGPAGSWEISAQADRVRPKEEARHRVSALTGEGIEALRSDLMSTARDAMPAPGQIALNARQAAIVATAVEELSRVEEVRDPLLIAEALRRARLAFDRLTGAATTEDMLDTLFSRFCIGK